jgi:hypothetical protein
MVQTIQSGANPTWNQTLDNSVAMNGVNTIQSFAFNNGSNGSSVVLLNLSLTDSLPVTFSGANAPTGSVQVQQLTADNISDTNENTSLVNINTSTLSSFNPSSGLSLPPYSMTVLTWNGGNTNTAPVISGVSASGISGSSATITWTTDQASSSLVQYGATTAYGSSSGVNSSMTTSHSMTLSGLKAGSTYNYDVTSANASGTSATSANYTFSTPAQAPVISNVVAGSISGTSATITWTTDQPSSSQIQYGTSSSYGSSSNLNPSLTTTHSVTITGLTPGTTYDYAVTSANSNGNSATSPNFTFTTVLQAPVISAVSVSSITGTSVVISWTTDQASSSRVNYGTSTLYGSSTALNSTLATSHSVTLTGLNPSTTYDYDVTSANSAGTSATSANFTFSTLAQAPVISAVSTSGMTATSVIITWTTDQASSSQVNYGTSTSYGSTSASNSTLVTSHSITLNGLNPGTTYDYDVTSANSAGTPATSANFTFSTLAQAPAISAVNATSITNNSATITWTTNQTATSLVNYGTTASYGASSALNSALATSHSVVLSGLSAGTTYNYDVVSANSGGTSATSANFTFTTAVATSTPSTPAPQVFDVAFWGISSSSITISWSTNQGATTWVAYGVSTALGQSTPVQTALTWSHGVVITGLTSGTKYYFVAKSANSSGAVGSSTVYSFQTIPTAPPVISNIVMTPGWGNKAQISWTTSVPANSFVEFGLTTSYGKYSTLATMTTNPQPAMGWVPSGLVHYRLISTDSYGNQAISPDYTFTEP